MSGKTVLMTTGLQFQCESDDYDGNDDDEGDGDQDD